MSDTDTAQLALVAFCAELNSNDDLLGLGTSVGRTVDGVLAP